MNKKIILSIVFILMAGVAFAQVAQTSTTAGSSLWDELVQKQKEAYEALKNEPLVKESIFEIERQMRKVGGATDDIGETIVEINSIMKEFDDLFEEIEEIEKRDEVYKESFATSDDEFVKLIKNAFK